MATQELKKAETGAMGKGWWVCLWKGVVNKKIFGGPEQVLMDAVYYSVLVH